MKYLILLLFLVSGYDSCQKSDSPKIDPDPGNFTEFWFSQIHLDKHDGWEGLGTIDGKVYTNHWERDDFMEYIVDSAGQFTWKHNGVPFLYNIDTITPGEVYKVHYRDAYLVARKPGPYELYEDE